MIIQEAAFYSLKRDKGFLEVESKKFNHKDDACTACGKSVVTLEHVILECGSVYSDVDTGTVTHPEALGSVCSRGNANESAEEVSRKLLEDRWLKTRAEI